MTMTALENTIIERIDRITEMPADYYVPAPPIPRSCKIELTGRCNFACAFCARSLLLRDQKDMDRALYSRLIRELHDAGVHDLGFFHLGESFMVSWLPEAIQEANDVGFGLTFLTTNGSLSTGKRVEACMEAGLHSLKFSLNYADKQQFMDIARVKGSLFDTMVNNIKDAYRVREAGGYRCQLSASYITYDEEQGERMQALIYELRPFLDEIYELPLYNQADLMTEEEQSRGWVPSAGNRGRKDMMRAPLPCWVLFTEAHISWQGQLAACCFDHNITFDMGNLNEMSFKEAWHSEAFQKLRAASLAKDVRGTPCENCVVGG
jgi:MoaA/NifB/PqqE/SkfB family radical SAM enzyme